MEIKGISSPKIANIEELKPKVKVKPEPEAEPAAVPSPEQKNNLNKIDLSV